MTASLFKKCHVLTPPNNWVPCSCYLTPFPHWNENSKKEVKLVGWKKNCNNNNEKGKDKWIKLKKNFFGQPVSVAHHLRKDFFLIFNLNLTSIAAVLKKAGDTSSHISQIPSDYQFHLILVFFQQLWQSLSHS